MEEFWRQGDLEAASGMPVSPFYDRGNNQTSQCQIGFINVLVRPLLSEWVGFLGSDAERDVIVTLEATLRLWETSGAKVIDSWGDFATLKGPAVGAGAEASVSTADAAKDGKAKGKDAKKEQKKDGKPDQSSKGEGSNRAPLQQRL